MAGVTSAGFVRKLESDCIGEMVDDARARIDPDLDDSPDSTAGQIFGIVGSKHAELWEVLEAVWNSLSENGSGVQLDRLAALTGTTRKAGETDAQLRLRRRQELSDQGATTEGAMRAALSKLSGMTAVRVVSNRSLVTDSAGRPPKSVEAIVLGTATQAAVSQTIWDNLAAGIEAYGTKSSSVTDSEGHSQPLKYSEAVAQPLYLRLTAKIDLGSYPGHDVLKQRLIDFTSGALTIETEAGLTIAGGVEIGGTVWASRIAAAALTVPGVVSVSQVQVGTSATALSTGDYPLDPRGYLGAAGVRGFALDHIEVVAT